MPLIKCPDCETDVSDQAVACPKCARPIKSAGGGRRSQSVSAEAAGDSAEDDDAAETGPTTLFPNFSKRPIPCPRCEKKSLRPRTRTRDFRCQACSVIFSGKEIEGTVARLNAGDVREARRQAARELIGQVNGSVWERCIPPERWTSRAELQRQLDELTQKPQPENRLASLFGAIGGLVGGPVAAYFTLDWLYSWPAWPRLVAACAAAVLGFSVVAVILSSTASWLFETKDPTDPVQTLRVRISAQTDWERTNPVLTRLVEDKFSNTARAAVIAEHGTVEERRVRAEAEAELRNVELEETLEREC